MKLMYLILILLTCSSSEYSQIYSPPESSKSLLKDVVFNKAFQLNEDYRNQFSDCDSRNYFNGIDMTLFKYRSCQDDKNKLRALLKFSNSAVFFESKMSIDVDGSWKACCEHPGKTDLCSTSYDFRTNVNGVKACEAYQAGKYVDPDVYPFIVIPTTAPSGISDRQKQGKEFQEKTQLEMGNVGIVIYKDKMVPVFVADGGPHNKIGEGSSALFRKLGEPWCNKFNSQNHCIKYRNNSIPDGVLFFVFPNSKIEGFNLKTPVERLAAVKQAAERKFNELKSLK